MSVGASADAMDDAVAPPPFVRGQNSLLFDSAGGQCIDLHAGYGAVFMGHGHPSITLAVESQLRTLAACGGDGTAAHNMAAQAMEQAFRSQYVLGGLYSTGMEANEFAFRLAVAATGKGGVAGFIGSMYGKSAATATLAWPAASPAPTGPGLAPAGCHRLHFPLADRQSESLDSLRLLLRTGTVGAVFVEPILGSSGGWAMDASFCHEVQALTREHGALLVFDEVLTGFQRTGPRFQFEALGVTPDVVIAGKACGNGFPVSVAMLRPHVREATARALPGSTFSGNPLACVALAATWQAMETCDMEGRVAHIAATVQAGVGPVCQGRFALRGTGALWVVDGIAPDATSRLMGQLRQRGVRVSGSGRQIRLLPPSTIEPELLNEACAIIADALSALP